MICDICNKNQATVHLTEIIDNQITELHLCEQCAREKSIQMEQQFGLADLLAGLADFGKQLEEPQDVNLKCPSCDMTYENFKKIGRLGCSECYVTFKKNLGVLLKKIHGSSQHFGKCPMNFEKQALPPRSELQELKDKLQAAIKREEFEEAAKLRDRIRELELTEKKQLKK